MDQMDDNSKTPKGPPFNFFFIGRKQFSNFSEYSYIVVVKYRIDYGVTFRITVLYFRS